MDNGAVNYERFISGDEEGLVEIVREYKDGMILYINSIIRDIHIAEDIVEDTFVKLVVKKPRFHNKSKFKTWLYKIAQNTANDYLRKNSRKKDVCIEEVIINNVADSFNNIEGFEKLYFQKEMKMSLYKALQGIKNEYRQAVYLVYFENFTNSQVATIMNKTNRQIENILYRAKLSLKKELLDGGFLYEDI